MKVTCTICGGTLVVDVGGSIATCTSCGMGYTIERVREMVGGSPKGTPKEEAKRPSEPIKQPAGPIKQSVESTKQPAEPLWEEVKIEPVKILIRTSVADGFQKRTLYGVVESGTFELGNNLYVDGNEQKVCHADQIKKNGAPVEVVEKGMQIALTFYGSQVKNLKEVKYLTAPAAPSGDAEEERYFTQLITMHFKGYTLKRNVRVSVETPAIPASYVLFKNNKPVLAIILCSSKIYDAKKIVNTMEACKQHGISVQRYFTDFENDKEYVINRIKSAL